MPHSKSDFDTPWQTILEDFFEQFVAFCLPTLYHKIDWEKGYTMLVDILTCLKAGDSKGAAKPQL